MINCIKMATIGNLARPLACSTPGRHMSACTAMHKRAAAIENPAQVPQLWDGGGCEALYCSMGLWLKHSTTLNIGPFQNLIM